MDKYEKIITEKEIILKRCNSKHKMYVELVFQKDAPPNILIEEKITKILTENFLKRVI